MKTAIALVMILSVATPSFAATLYVRAGGAVEHGADTTVHDRDCASTTPPALFGCVEDAQGRRLAARGDFGTIRGLELTFGAQLGAHSGVELAWTSRDLDLAASANFTGVRGPQPVRAQGRSNAILFNGVWTFRPDAEVQPFAFVGAGVARNELNEVVYSFPSIAPNAVTVTQGGSSAGLAWNAGAGVSMRMTSTLFVDVSLRYTDLGGIETEAGAATIVRPSRTLVLPIAATEGEAQAFGASIALKWRR